MKIIEIKTVEDFEQLRKLNKKESVLLKIYDPMSKVQLSSIDLKGFRGRITVSFQNSKHPYYFNVIVENENGNTFIFSNVNSSIIYLDQGNYEVFYQVHPKIYGITEDADFNSLPKRLLPKTKLILQQDLVLKQRILPSLRCNIGW